MKTKPLTSRQLEEIRVKDSKMCHRPLAERAAFLRDFLKLKISESELVGILAANPTKEPKP